MGSYRCYLNKLLFRHSIAIETLNQCHYATNTADILPISKSVLVSRGQASQTLHPPAQPPALPVRDAGEKKDPEATGEKRLNELNIQMLSTNIYRQLFKDDATSPDPKLITRCQEHLLYHGIDYKKVELQRDVQLTLPKLCGKDLLEHFQNIGEEQSGPYRLLLNQLAASPIPLIPTEWTMEAGWHRYVPNRPPERVPYPPDDSLVFDVEVLMAAGSQPTLACAVSAHCWYGWVSDALALGTAQRKPNVMEYEALIPLETGADGSIADAERPRVVVGHNVSYDRTRVKEQYWLEQTGLRFVDTMSMHVSVSGVTSYQRAVLKSKHKEEDPSDATWMDSGSLNSLADVHALYCASPIEKGARDTFVSGTMSDVRRDFQQLMRYCAGDASATHRVLQALLPLFLERFPHPVTLAGMLELGSAYLPVNSNWLQYIESADTTFEDLKLESRHLLSLKADEACRLLHNDAYQKDLWMWDQDWSTQTLKLKKATKKKIFEMNNMNEERDQEGINETDIKDNKEFVKIGDLKLAVLNENFIYNLEQSAVKPKSSERRKEMSKKFQYLYNMKDLLPVKRPQLAGFPAWYRKLCTKPSKDENWIPGAQNITTSMQITPKLLQLSWEGYPLHYIRSEGWGFLVPFSHRRPVDYVAEADEPQIPLKELLAACPVVEFEQQADGEQSERTLQRLWKSVEEDMGRRSYYARKKLDAQAPARYTGLGVWCGTELQGCCHFLRLPHKDGPKYKVGNPLAKDFLDKFSTNVLSAQGNDAENVLNLGRTMSYWRNNRERILGQQVVWLPPSRLPEDLRASVKQYGAIIPQVVVCGTLTRRAVEATWMTASNAHEERIGSELRAMVQAPPGYKFVGADVDSQELWIASLLGDSELGLAGATALGWAVLAGSKAQGTDLHSLTARAARISRDHAKVINYARIYGAGQNFAERLLKQFNPTMSNSEARSKAAKMFSTTKGRRVYRLRPEYMQSFRDEESDEQVCEMGSYQAVRLAKLSGKRVEEMFERPLWVGGTESNMFNKLEEIAESEAPATAFLGGRLSRALEHSEGRWASTRLNWAVQSAAADFLHLMLVSMRWLAPAGTRYDPCIALESEAPATAFLGGRLSRALEHSEGRWASTRLNWAVQSAAADFLHLMLVSMRWLAPAGTRFSLSFHDEVRYLVAEERRYEAALALQLTNLLTRAFCSQRVGLKDLPLSVAFFTSVEVDSVLRKESQHDCRTPSNPHGLQRGYGVPHGESLDIFDVLEKTAVK